MKKKTLFLALLSALTMGAQAAGYDYLVFTMTDGTTQAVASSNLTITFSDNYLVAGTTSIPLASLAKMEFSDEGTSGIENISVNTLATDDSVSIYDMSGRQMPRQAQLPKGVYIMKTNGKTVKVQIK